MFIRKCIIKKLINTSINYLSILPFINLMFKKIFHAIKKILEPIGKIISSIVNFILLGIVYFVGIGITSIIFKLFGKHFLDLKNNKASYWEERNLSKEPIEKYHRMY